MIATSETVQPSSSGTSPEMRRARRRAAALIGEPDVQPARRVPRWRGWLLVAWLLTVTLCYLLMLAGRSG